MQIYFYSGDVSIEHGGMFYTLEGNAVRVTPASDAGGPDNIFWIEELTFDLSKPCRDALRASDLPIDTTDPHARLQAMAWWGQCESYPIHTVQIGPVCPFTGHKEGPKPDLILRDGTDLKKWLRRRLKAWL